MLALVAAGIVAPHFLQVLERLGGQAGNAELRVRAVLELDELMEGVGEQFEQLLAR